MTSITRVLRLAAPAALAFLIAAPSALAVSPFTEFKCDNPAFAYEDLEDAVFFSALGYTGAYDEKDCKKLCKDLENICKKNAKNREQCVKDDDKAYYSALKDKCKIENSDKSDRKACQDDVKADEKSDKDDLKELKRAAKDNCREAFGKDSTCVADCGTQSFPFYD